jgi:hypothetical protein
LIKKKEWNLYIGRKGRKGSNGRNTTTNQEIM